MNSIAPRWKKLRGLSLLLSAALLALILYYVPDYYGLEVWTARASAFLLGLTGVPAKVWTINREVFLNDFLVVKLCTGIQATAILAGLILTLGSVRWKKKLLAIGIAAIGVHTSNLFRIVLELWLYYKAYTPVILTHYPFGFILGAISILGLMLIVDHFMPEVGDNLLLQARNMIG